MHEKKRKKHARMYFFCPEVWHFLSFFYMSGHVACRCPCRLILKSLDFRLSQLRTEVSVAPTSLAIDTTDHKPGSVSDLVIFRETLIFTREHFSKETMMIKTLESCQQST